MAVSSKNRRRITVNGRCYLWRVKRKKGPRLEIIDPESRAKYMSTMLFSVSHDFAEDVNLIISLGARVRTVDGESLVIITPKIVRDIIETFPVFSRSRHLSKP